VATLMWLLIPLSGAIIDWARRSVDRGAGAGGKLIS
jgi:hypothetical protein